MKVKPLRVRCPNCGQLVHPKETIRVEFLAGGVFDAWRRYAKVCLRCIERVTEQVAYSAAQTENH